MFSITVFFINPLLETCPARHRQIHDFFCTFTKNKKMFFEQLPSKYLENAVSELAKLPGVGRKTALRLALHLLRQDKSHSKALGNSLIELRENITYCRVCHNVSDTEICPVCSNPARDNSVICVVEDIRDVMAVERTSQFNGVYHVLGGLISPIDGIRPEDINLESLQRRAEENHVKEIILALSATVEGDTTAFYIFRQLQHRNITFSTISRGISIGDELEYIDEVTLGRSIQSRIPYQQMLVSDKS
jgi:recombination protein RecR